jgi:hypothetical protein
VVVWSLGFPMEEGLAGTQGRASGHTAILIVIMVQMAHHACSKDS